MHILKLVMALSFIPILAVAQSYPSPTVTTLFATGKIVTPETTTSGG